MNTPKIQFGSSEKTRVIDEKGTVLTVQSKYHGGKAITTNRLTIRDRIPTSRPTIQELEMIMKDLFYNPDKINPSLSIESHTNERGTAYDLVISYTVLEVV